MKKVTCAWIGVSVLGIVGSGVAITGAHAAKLCLPQGACDDLVIVAKAQPHEPVWSEVYKNEDGTPLLMKQAEAIAYCDDAGGHLPSAREYAVLAMSKGAIGIKETAYPDTGLPSRGAPESNYQKLTHEGDELERQGFQRVLHKDDGGTLFTEFYFKSTGYKGGTDESEKETFWTSTLSSAHYNDAVTFNGEFASFSAERQFWKQSHAVRCIGGF